MSAEVGLDRSGNNNNWTVNSLSINDQMTGESPTNNFATLNPLFTSGATLSEGNLKGSFAGGDEQATGTMSVTTGKWYYEMVTLSSSGDAVACGFANVSSGPTDVRYNTADGGVDWTKLADGRTIRGGVGPHSSGFDNHDTTGDIVGVMLDLDNDTIQWKVNNATASSAVSITTGKAYTPVFYDNSGSTYSAVANFGQDSSFAGAGPSGSATASDSGGIGDFFYAPPSGFKALCTKNLSDPAVVPKDNFGIHTYAGGIAGYNIGFEPSFVWIKQRSAVNRSHDLFDQIRGGDTKLSSDTAAASLLISIKAILAA